MSGKPKKTITTSLIDKNTKDNLKKMNKIEQDINELNETSSDQT